MFIKFLLTIIFTMDTLHIFLPSPSWMPSVCKISLSLATSSLSSLMILAFGSSLTTALHTICLALSAYLIQKGHKNKYQVLTVQCIFQHLFYICYCFKKIHHLYTKWYFIMMHALNHYYILLKTAHFIIVVSC